LSKNQNKPSLQATRFILSGVSSKWCPSPRLCIRAHTLSLQRWRFADNV